MEGKSYTFGANSITVIEGDITARTADAIVNAANNHLWMGSGVAGAIKRKGGELIEREAVAQGPIAVGSAVVTSAGALPCKFVIHAAAMGQDLTTDAAKISAATASSLQKCADFKLDSVSFPALGTGVGGFSIAECAALMLSELAAHFGKSRYPSKVEFVLFGERAYAEFAMAVDDFFAGKSGFKRGGG